MSTLHALLAAEVHPAMGCTEAGAVARAGAMVATAVRLDHPNRVKEILLRVDPGTYKNGCSVIVPHCDGKRGLPIALAAGIVCGPQTPLNLQILGQMRESDLRLAVTLLPLIETRICSDWQGFHVEVAIKTEQHDAAVVLDNFHENVVELTLDGVPQEVPHAAETAVPSADYQRDLAALTLPDMIALAQSIDDETRLFIREGIRMNRDVAQAGLGRTDGVGQHLRHILSSQTIDHADWVTAMQMYVAAAADARMGGIPLPAMSSGNSGNQGFVAILPAAIVGQRWGISQRRIDEAVALSHVLNAYAKCYLGQLSSLCGCAVAAGIGAAASIVYLRCNDPAVIDAAICNVLGMIAGLLCDGAKESCALKVATSAHAAGISAVLALDAYHVPSHGIGGADGLESIRNLQEIVRNGMPMVDQAILTIMQRRCCS